jgi:O-antigen/teichoic acid export membrane protein
MLLGGYWPARFSPTRQAAVAAMATAVASQVALAASGILAARMLGVDGRGHFALLTLFPALLSQVGNLGLPMAATYFIASRNGTTRAVTRALRIPAVVQCLALLSAHIGILLAVTPARPIAFTTAALLTLPVSPLLLIQQYGLALVQGQRRFLSFNIPRLPARSLSEFSGLLGDRTS